MQVSANDPTLLLDLLDVDEAPRFEPGMSVGPYRLLHLLGTGGMADVFEVHHQRLDNRHALKVPRFFEVELRARLLQEARVQAALVHPNIVKVVDAIDTRNGQLAVVMELVRGPTLTRWLQAETAPPMSQLVELYRGVVRAVAHTHAQGFAHRDIKPSNVLIARDERGLTPKLTDFGISKVLGQAKIRPSAITRQGVSMGTAGFVSPEQLLDASKATVRSDVFSLGCLLHYALVGRPPFMETDRAALLTAMAAGPPAWLTSAGMPPAVQALLEQMLAPEPSDRPADADHVLRMLDDIPDDVWNDHLGLRAAPFPPIPCATVIRPVQSATRRIPTIGPFGYRTPLPL